MEVLTGRDTSEQRGSPRILNQHARTVAKLRVVVGRTGMEHKEDEPHERRNVE